MSENKQIGYLDLETKWLFSDLKCWEHPEKLGLAVAGLIVNTIGVGF